VSAAKHTPGPWQFDPDEMAQGADDIFTISVRGPGALEEALHITSVTAFALLSEEVNGSQYVTADAPPVDMLEQAKANARLIAAAPDLPEALQRLMNGTTSLHDAMQAAQQARAAIAKATGEGA